MDSRDVRGEDYVVPTYVAPEDTAFYHFLHGSVPGHQIDFMHRPEVPHGPLNRQHFGHLARLMKYIAPRENSPYAFAIGNLSRDDTQHEPGHGGMAFLFGLRIRGAMDHVGRRDPPFSHAIAAINRQLDAQTIQKAALAFYQGLFPGDKADAFLGDFYDRYARCAVERREQLRSVLDAYLASFANLPQPGSSELSLRWTIENASPPKQVLIVHEGETLPFEAWTGCASRIAAMLYVSDVRWTSITNGREADLPGGVSIRLVPKHDASSREPDATVIPIEEVPQEEAEIAERLFGAAPVQRSAMPRAMPRWREQIGPPAELPANTSDRPPEPQSEDSPRVIQGRLEPAATNAPTRGMSDEGPRSRLPLWIALFAVSAVGIILVYSFATTSERLPERVPATSPSETLTAKAVPRPQETSEASAGIIPAESTPNAGTPPMRSAPPASTASAPPVSARNTSPATALSAGRRSQKKTSSTQGEIQLFDAPLDLSPNEEVLQR
jgi:hypothetical protein